MTHFTFALLFSQYLLACTPTQITRIALSESTRGTLRRIEVTAERTIVQLNNEEKSFTTKTTDWQVLSKLAQDLPPAQLGGVKVLSKKHQVDAALASTLTIATPDSTYTSPTFDHNAPPAALALLVDSLHGQIQARAGTKF